MNYNKLEYFVSQPRLDKFLAATGNSKVKAQKLYRVNLRLAQSVYPLLSLFEIFFRNAIYNQIDIYFANPDWILHEKNRFMSDRSLLQSRFWLKQSVQNAENSILRKGGVVTSGKVIAEQTFGFWTSLFEPHHYRLIGGSAIHCFPYKPTNVNRSSIAGKLNFIREFRNRVYHNEPICFLNGSIDFTKVSNIMNTIYELLEWMDPDLKTYVENFDNIDAKIMNGLRI